MTSTLWPSSRSTCASYTAELYCLCALADVN